MSGRGGKTNAMRALDRLGVHYQAHEYDPEIRSADGVAQVLGLPEGVVYKTLVMLRDGGGPMLVMVPGDREVQPRVLARSLGAKSVRMALKSEAERLTGLQTGGIGALALLDRGFDVYVDEAVLSQEEVLVNGGRRGLNLGLRTADLLRVTGAQTVATSERD